MHVCEWFAASVVSSTWNQCVKNIRFSYRQKAQRQAENFISGCSVKRSKITLLIFWFLKSRTRKWLEADAGHVQSCVQETLKPDIQYTLINKYNLVNMHTHIQIISTWFFFLLFFYLADNEIHTLTCTHTQASSARHQSQGLSLFVDGCLNLQLTSQVCSFILKWLKHQTLRSCPLLS